MATQFLGAFNDNAFKIVISLFALSVLSGPAVHARFMSLISALFIIPFIVFSPYAGQIADRYSKRNIIVGMKIAEIMIMILGLFAFMSGKIFWMCVVLFLMTLQSAFFGPAKYGILPEMLGERELSKGNGYMGMWTFVAIIIGTAVGGQLMTVFTGDLQRISFILIGVAISGALSSLLIRQTKVVPNQRSFEVNPFKDISKYFLEIRRDRALFLTLLGVGYFWFLGSIFQMNVMMYGHNFLNLSDVKTSLLLVSVSIGVGLGSFFPENYPKGRLSLGLFLSEP